jgi:hypothetical protein
MPLYSTVLKLPPLAELPLKVTVTVFAPAEAAVIFAA